MLYSIYVRDIKQHVDLIDRIKYFVQNNDAGSDFVVFTENILHPLEGHCVLTTFYMIAHVDYIIFLDIDDYIQYKDSISGRSILYITKDDIANMDHNLLKGCSILTEIENNIQWIKNYEL